MLFGEDLSLLWSGSVWGDICIYFFVRSLERYGIFVVVRLKKDYNVIVSWIGEGVHEIIIPIVWHCVVLRDGGAVNFVCVFGFGEDGLIQMKVITMFRENVLSLIGLTRSKIGEEDLSKHLFTQK